MLEVVLIKGHLHKSNQRVSINWDNVTGFLEGSNGGKAIIETLKESYVLKETYEQVLEQLRKQSGFEINKEKADEQETNQRAQAL